MWENFYLKDTPIWHWCNRCIWVKIYKKMYKLSLKKFLSILPFCLGFVDFPYLHRCHHYAYSATDLSRNPPDSFFSIFWHTFSCYYPQGSLYVLGWGPCWVWSLIIFFIQRYCHIGPHFVMWQKHCPFMCTARGGNDNYLEPPLVGGQGQCP